MPRGSGRTARGRVLVQAGLEGRAQRSSHLGNHDVATPFLGNISASKTPIVYGMGELSSPTS